MAEKKKTLPTRQQKMQGEEAEMSNDDIEQRVKTKSKSTFLSLDARCFSNEMEIL